MDTYWAETVGLFEIDQDNKDELEIYDVDENAEVVQKYGIKSVPTFIILDDEDEIVANKTGALQRTQLSKWLGEFYDPRSE